MKEADDCRSHLSRNELDMLPEVHIRHPFNAASDVYLKRLSPVFGLERLALYIARIPPGRESFLYHCHERDEEFVVILSGRGLAEIGDRFLEVGTGDIMAFPAPGGPPHHLTNPHEDDLVYLMGGERSGIDVAHFPKLGRHLVFAGSRIWSFDEANSQRLTLSDWNAYDLLT